MSMRNTLAGIFIAVCLSNFAPLRAEEIPPAFAEAEKSIAAVRLPDGFKLEVFAAEPQLGAPVAIAVDEQGRVFVAEEYRFNRGTEENRTRAFLLEDDLQLNTTEDRLKMYQKWATKFDGGMDWFTRHGDQVRLLEDRNGDGKADFSSIFAGPFKEPLDGLAAGVLARRGQVYFTCIPHLWRLQDTDGDSKADEREALLSGFGVNAAFLGHDLHGLIFGPDGKLYFSVGDRGFHVVTKEGRTLSGPRTGAVFRCNPNGSELEVVHRGLRNPQELAFDEFGNLFADDNNCDKGDHARLVYVVEEGDSGWNMAYQTLAAPYLTGPWHAEKIWHLPHAEQPFGIVPPAGKLGAGPSGFCYNPGVGLDEKFAGHFFMCNYTGNGGVETFSVRPRGAGFEAVDYRDFLKPIPNVTDMTFGYDGTIYLSDFVGLIWNGGNERGRIYRLFNPKQLASPAAKEMHEVFRRGFESVSSDRLAELLKHADLRVRQEAQFTLVERGDASREILHAAATQKEHRLARLHGIWGLGQLGVQNKEIAADLLPLLADEDFEIRAQAAKTIGQVRWPGANAKLIELLADENARVRYFAAQSLGQLRHEAAIDAIAAMLRENADTDPYLRHAGVVALWRMENAEAIERLATDNSPAVRMAALLVQRRTADPRIAQFLVDADPRLVLEAARAINDVPIPQAMSALANLAVSFELAPSTISDPLARRVINANFRLGLPKHLSAVARLVTSKSLSPAMQLEAATALADWAEPSPRDRVIGYWRPLEKRDAAQVRAILEPLIPQMLAQSNGATQTKIAELVTKLQIPTSDETFIAWLNDDTRSDDARIAALKLLAQRKHAHLSKLITTAQQASSPQLRAAALDVLADKEPNEALKACEELFARDDASLIEQQSAIATLSRMHETSADDLLVKLAETLGEKQASDPLAVDFLEAFAARPSKANRAIVAKYEAGLAADDPLAKFRIALQGGSVERGRNLFVGHSTGQCLRCHRIAGQGGDAGPDLSKVREKNSAEHLLESLIVPNAKIAPGFGSVNLVLADGRIVSGVIKEETPEHISLLTPAGKLEKIASDDIDERSTPQSPMPPMGENLSLRELRDLLAYLQTLKP